MQQTGYIPEGQEPSGVRGEHARPAAWSEPSRERARQAPADEREEPLADDERQDRGEDERLHDAPLRGRQVMDAVLALELLADELDRPSARVGGRDLVRSEPLRVDVRDVGVEAARLRVADGDDPEDLAVAVPRSPIAPATEPQPALEVEPVTAGPVQHLAQVSTGLDELGVALAEHLEQLGVGSLLQSGHEVAAVAPDAGEGSEAVVPEVEEQEHAANPGSDVADSGVVRALVGDLHGSGSVAEHAHDEVDLGGCRRVIRAGARVGPRQGLVQGQHRRVDAHDVAKEPRRRPALGSLCHLRAGVLDGTPQPPHERRGEARVERRRHERGARLHLERSPERGQRPLTSTSEPQDQRPEHGHGRDLPEPLEPARLAGGGHQPVVREELLQFREDLGTLCIASHGVASSHVRQMHEMRSRGLASIPKALFPQRFHPIRPPLSEHGCIIEILDSGSHCLLVSLDHPHDLPNLRDPLYKVGVAACGKGSNFL